MPQFDPTYFASQFFWLIICFLFLLAYMAIFAIPRVRKGIADRENFIEEMKDRQTSYVQRIDELLQEITEIKKHQFEEAKTYMDQLQQKLAHEKEEQLKHLQQKFIIDRNRLSHDLSRETEALRDQMPKLTKEILELFEEKLLTPSKEASKRHAVN